MFLDIHPQFQNSTFNSTNSLGTDDIFAICKDMYEGVVVWACFSSVCCLFGFPACVFVLWELLQRHRRGTPITPNDVFMLNLTVMDLLFFAFMPLAIPNYVFWYIRPIEHLFSYLYSFPLTGRPLFMTCICLDCYLAVVHPITYRARKGLTSRVLMSIGVWAFTLAYGTLEVLLYVDNRKHTVTIILYVFTILTTGICDLFIFRALKSSGPGGRELHPQKKKALQVIVNSLVMTVIAYLPPLIMNSFSTLIPVTGDELICRVWFPLYCYAPAGSTIMPVLYLSNLGKLDFIHLWCCKAV